MDKNFEQSITRLQEIEWGNIDSNKPSLQILVNEFIRRGNKFRDMYEAENKKRMAIFSAAQIINAPIGVNIEEIINDFKISSKGWTTEYLCKFYLEWCYLFTEGRKEVIQSHGIYEPIIKFYERGGILTYHNNELICGHYFWPRNCYSIPREPEFDISNKYLDIIDIQSLI